MSPPLQPVVDRVAAFAPATVANVVSGFDRVGFAVSAPGDEVRLAVNDSGRVTLDAVIGDGGRLPVDPDRNIASAMVKLYLRRIGSEASAAGSIGIGVTLIKNMPVNSGMGSSSASGVAALVAANALFGSPLSRRELLLLAMEGERMASGSAHLDNVAPALLGGMTVVVSADPVEVASLPVPALLRCVLVHPDIDIPTRLARERLPSHVPLADLVAQSGYLAALVAGFCLADLDLITKGMRDIVVEPARSGLIPGFEEMKRQALAAGALGFGISGSGPAVFAFCAEEASCGDVRDAILGVCADQGMRAQAYVSPINVNGAHVIDPESTPSSAAGDQPSFGAGSSSATGAHSSSARP